MRHLATLSIAIATLFSLPAHAEFKKLDDAVEYRQGVFTVMAEHFGRIGAVVKGEKAFDKTAVQKDAAVVEMMSQLPWQAFVPGSDMKPSHAKPEVWKQAAEFEKAAQKNREATAKLSEAAKSGDLQMIKTAFGEAGKSCKACHDQFKKK